MSHPTSSCRTAAALGATALLGVVLAAPALAKPVPGPNASAETTTSSSSPRPPSTVSGRSGATPSRRSLPPFRSSRPSRPHPSRR